ncbi:30S ribosomal subunit protein S10 [Candidatus Xenohaliotis californiensis]|uniref:Small ribosomal subunit protein uS10 n=1 Tax=Candidatus Xenohaliotis californiensis TaxID=84677 RepID=A0ABP0EXV9_9RICK|nr:30S ribosomal subunit protein S10 [Candidatus Xenohaliotis californiensis]
MSMGSISIKLRSFDYRMLDFFTRSIVERILKTGATINGPIPLPSKRSIVTVNRSPHVDKKSREHFAIMIYKRLIVLHNTNPRTVEVLARLELPAGVDVHVKS